MYQQFRQDITAQLGLSASVPVRHIYPGEALNVIRGENMSGLTEVIELCVHCGATPFSKFVDLNMPVTAGRERTEAEYRALLGGAGLKLTRIIPPLSQRQA
jgi:hypothetical protein